MITVRVQNFQSIIDETLSFEGLSAITGPNTTGKSAFLRAIKGLVQNTRGNKFVRNGCEHCTVTLTFSDGVSIRWQKGKGTNRYQINEEPWIEKVSSGVPEEVSKLLGIDSVTVGSHVLWPQIADQHDKIFLLNLPGSAMAEAIADVEKVGLLNEALRLAESDRRKKNSCLSIRQSDLESVNKELSIYEGFSSLESLLQEISDLESDISCLDKDLETFVRIRAAYDESRAVVEHLLPVSDVSLDFSSPLKSLGKVDSLVHTFEKLLAYREDAVSRISMFESQLSEMPNFSSIYQSLSEVEDLGEHCHKLNVLSEERGKSVVAISRLEKEIASLASATDSKISEFDHFMSLESACPLCGREGVSGG